MEILDPELFKLLGPHGALIALAVWLVVRVKTKEQRLAMLERKVRHLRWVVGMLYERVVSYDSGIGRAREYPDEPDTDPGTWRRKP